MRRTKQVLVGGVPIGGGAPVAIQSMLSVPAHDIEGNLRQAAALEAAGCRIIRAAVPDREAVPLIAALKEHTGMPVVADIHFDYRLALEAVAAGADKIRINPGNIGGAVGSVRWQTPAMRGRSRSAWGSTPARWSASCWPDSAGRPRRQWWKARRAT